MKEVLQSPDFGTKELIESREDIIKSRIRDLVENFDKKAQGRITILLETEVCRIVLAKMSQDSPLSIKINRHDNKRVPIQASGMSSGQEDELAGINHDSYSLGLKQVILGGINAIDGKRDKEVFMFDSCLHQNDENTLSILITELTYLLKYIAAQEPYEPKEDLFTRKGLGLLATQ